VKYCRTQKLLTDDRQWMKERWRRRENTQRRGRGGAAGWTDGFRIWRRSRKPEQINGKMERLQKRKCFF